MRQDIREFLKKVEEDTLPIIEKMEEYKISSLSLTGYDDLVLVPIKEGSVKNILAFSSNSKEGETVIQKLSFEDLGRKNELQEYFKLAQLLPAFKSQLTKEIDRRLQIMNYYDERRK